MIRVDEDLFGAVEAGACTDTSLAVVSDAPQSAVVAALVATGRRWLCITHSGHDLSDEPDDDAFHRRLEELRVAQGRADWTSLTRRTGSPPSRSAATDRRLRPTARVR